MPELQLVNEDLNDDIYRVIEEAELDAEQEDEARARASPSSTTSSPATTGSRPSRRTSCATSSAAGFVGKAMVVSIDKATAVRMYDKVQKLWGDERAGQDGAGRAGLPAAQRRWTPEQAQRDRRIAELKHRLDVLVTTDMAVIVSPGQNEIEQMQKRVSTSCRTASG